MGEGHKDPSAGSTEAPRDGLQRRPHGGLSASPGGRTRCPTGVRRLCSRVQLRADGAGPPHAASERLPRARRCQRGPKRRPELPEAPRGAANPRRSAGGAGPPRGSAAERCPGGAEPRSAPWRRPTGLCPTARRGERAAARPRRRGKRR